jgi:hypothetical protein
METFKHRPLGAMSIVVESQQVFELCNVTTAS